MDKLVALSLLTTMVAASWPPVLDADDCGEGAQADYDGNCCTFNGMTRQQCSVLASAWVTGKCVPTSGGPGAECDNFSGPEADSTACYVNRAVQWIGPGCPKPCYDRAKKLRKNPARYCKSMDQDIRWQDGGCQLWNACPHIVCEKTCESHPWCEWEGQHCQYRNGDQTVPKRG
jgi:hypothetical protein